MAARAGVLPRSLRQHQAAAAAIMGRVSTSAQSRRLVSSTSRKESEEVNLDHLKAEGDINLSPRRARYAERNTATSPETVELLDRDSKAFLHQVRPLGFNDRGHDRERSCEFENAAALPAGPRQCSLD